MERWSEKRNRQKRLQVVLLVAEVEEVLE